MITEKIVIASDHAGYFLKEQIKKYLSKKLIESYDVGTYSSDSCDYPDFAHKLAEEIEKGAYKYGISICGSGNGINMTVNKHQKIRSALCWNDEIAQLARFHNDANICSLPARFISEKQAYTIIDIFFNTEFEGGRHITRINKIPLKK
ncbi:MAG: ribose 5-phosphate isomerase B [Bacteroidales bacterium]|nr:ribose 5-phosphate isomerase B [Bacteroidales bacterium]MCF8389684.1 ribose 5-phosphate isomerase B [Bacteroidales bacterium]